MARLVLVGPDQQDNLALRYLAGAVSAANHVVSLVRFNNRGDLGAVVKRIIADPPDIIGFGMSFQYAVENYLALARAIRTAGFQGHVTCGGHVPTFCYREILTATDAIDSAVRHDGEQTIVDMLSALDSGLPIRDIDGLVWRDGAAIIAGPIRSPETFLDALPTPLPRETGPLSVGGAPIAFIITARGCFGDCAYCSIQAFSRDAGGPRFRMRRADTVASEIAEYYHRHHVRTFFIQDDIFILPSRTRTLERLKEFGSALSRHGVTDAHFWAKGRPESITPEIAAAARSVGVVHLFLGVESASDERLRYLGRTHNSRQNRASIANCEAVGIRPSFNLMLFDPDSTLTEIAQTVSFARETAHLPWNVCRTEIYSGTRLEQRLRDEGRLTGDFRTYGYVMKDLRAEMMFRIMRVSFAERAFAVDSLLNSLISLAFGRQVHEALFPGAATTHISASVDQLLIDVHLDCVVEMERIIAFVSHCAVEDTHRIRRFAVDSALRMAESDRHFRSRFHLLWVLLNARGSTLYERYHCA